MCDWPKESASAKRAGKKVSNLLQFELSSQSNLPLLRTCTKDIQHTTPTMTTTRIAQSLIICLVVIVSLPASLALPSRRTAIRRSLFAPKKSESRGTSLVFRKPTSQSTSKLFHSATASSYNHATVGMTNPSLHISVDDQVVLQISTKPSSNKKVWFPETLTEAAASCWQKLEYRQQVGFGRSCYEAVRDSILVWEFEKDNKGIVSVQRNAVLSSSPSLIRHAPSHGGYEMVHTGTQAHDSPQNWHSTSSALSIGDCQTLATYTRSGPFWCVNPVKVVYDVVDQRGPSSTYTSSAYATLKGHWLAGEERMTVALRDDGQVNVQIVSYSKPAKLWTRLAWPLVNKMQNKFFTSQLEWLQQVATDNQQEHLRDVVLPLVSKPVPMPMKEPVVSLPLR